METLTLFRGDYEKIDEFYFHKTNKDCYVGPGVYLTNNVRVAHSYRTKGSPYTVEERTLFSGTAKDRPDAISKALPRFFQQFYRPGLIEQNASLARMPFKKLEATYMGAAKQRLQELVLEGAIKVNYLTKPYFGSPRVLEVVFDKVAIKHGYITEFAFPKQAFDKSMIHIHRPITDPVFWEIMFDKRTGFGTPYASREDYIRNNVQRRDNPAISTRFSVRARKETKSTYEAIRRATMPHGYRGFEYNGGSVIGGYGQHWAFCVWDDDFVNEYKVRQFI